MISRLPMIGALAIGAACVTACTGPDAAASRAAREDDPAITRALAAPLMVEPDLGSVSNAETVLFGGGPPRIDIPTEPDGADAAAPIRAEAQVMAGGKLLHAPKPSSRPGEIEFDDIAGIARLALGAAAAGCMARIEYSAQWAARLPSALPIYPRGHVQEAAGTDRDGCGLRAVDYTTPVGADEVIDFYFTKARSAGFALRNEQAGGARVLSGTRGDAGFAVFVRHLDGERSEVALIVSGG